MHKGTYVHMSYECVRSKFKHIKKSVSTRYKIYNFYNLLLMSYEHGEADIIFYLLNSESISFLIYTYT